MFDEPQEDPSEKALNQSERAKEKADEIRMYSELAAVFEGPRKFEAQLLSGLDPSLAREVQRVMARLEKAKAGDIPLIPPESAAEATELLRFFAARDLSANDYHIHRRPGETMMIRWLVGEQVESFYERFQAHFNVGFEGYRDEERQASEWKQDPKTAAYLAALDAIEIKMADRYLREPIRQHGLSVLSTQTADEFNINYLADYVMGVEAAEIVGEASAPPEAATERDLAWFFKLYSLRGVIDGAEHMCFFTFMQKSDDTFDFD